MKISIDDLFRHSLCISVDAGRYKAFAERWKGYGLPVPPMFHGYNMRVGDYRELRNTTIRDNVTNCSFSHAAAVKMAQALGWPFVCIFEDDAIPCISILDKLPEYLSRIPDGSDLVRLGELVAPNCKVPAPVMAVAEDGMYYSARTWGSHAYIVFSRYYDKYEYIFNNVCMWADGDVVNYSPKVHGDVCRIWMCRDLLFGQKEPLPGYGSMHGKPWGQEILNNGEDFRWCDRDVVECGKDALGNQVEIFNGLPKVVYQFWTGDNPMTENRKLGIESARSNFGVRECLVDGKDLAGMKLPHPLHPAYRFLSTNHRSDYLRCYFMNFFGGGYADIKIYGPDNNWKKSFDSMGKVPEVMVCGAEEIPGGSPVMEYENDATRKKLLANCFFICRPHTEFTEIWFARVEKYLDGMLGRLSRHPSTEPFGGPGYPVPWAAVQGCIFHRMCVEQYDKDMSAMRSSLRPGWLNRLPYR